MTNTNDMREEFERAYARNFGGVASIFKSLRVGNEYPQDSMTDVDTAWIIWQAACEWQSTQAQGESAKLNKCCWHKDQAEAWKSVGNLLTELVPNWIYREGLNAEEAAIATIRELAAPTVSRPTTQLLGYLAIGKSNLVTRREYGETVDEAAEKMKQAGFYTFDIKELRII